MTSASDISVSQWVQHKLRQDCVSDTFPNILIYIQHDATLHSLFYLEIALHVSGGTTTHHQKRIQMYLQHLLFVIPLLLSAAVVEQLELV
jgi:hypothetical protein